MTAEPGEKDIIERFAREKQKSGRELPNIDFRDLIGAPVFLECVCNSRIVHTVHGERELAEVRILEDADTLKKGEEYTWWLTQKVVQTKIQEYKPLKGRKLCIVCLGEKRGHRFSYFDYYIGSEEEGRSILEDLGGT
jgi:hypothetical protein